MARKNSEYAQAVERGVPGMLPVVVAMLIFTILVCAPHAAESRAAERHAAANTMGSWTAPVDIGVVGINAALLNTGKVLLFFYPASPATQSPAVVYDPVTGAVTSVTPAISRNIFCSGMSILSNGQVMVTGGMASSLPGPHDGTKSTMLFDPGKRAWTVGNPMNLARWYPTNTELPDGSVLVLSGLDETATKLQLPMEVYSQTTGSWTMLPASANMPKDSDTYPRMVVMPSGKVFKAGFATDTQMFDPATNTWTFVANLNFGPRVEGGVVLLPGLKKVLTAGGSTTAAGDGTATAEIIDFSAATPAWAYTGSMNFGRKHQNLVLLADGTVLAVGGGATGKYSAPIKQAELYDPVHGTWTVMASQTAQRTYHSTAVLLADGRVLSAGSDSGNMSTTVEIYSPPYLFKGARPGITSAPSALKYGQQFTISTPDAANIQKVALIRPGATTHADDFDQRYVQLKFAAGTGQLTATAPASGNYAPPGYYMIVIVNRMGIPSVATFTQIH